jgi:ParB-like chromosome segregation protein Spo0J
MTAQLKIVYKKTEDLIPYARNSRTHDESQIAQIAASIKEFGFTNPILLDGQNGIIAGHGRVMAAQKLGEEKVPTIELAHLSEHQKRAYIIADNKLALNSGWDDQMLALEISDLKDSEYDLGILGFSIEDIDKIIEEVNFDPATEEEQGKLDELDPKWIDCPHCGKEFDVRKN